MLIGLIACFIKQCADVDPASVVDDDGHSRLIGHTPADLKWCCKGKYNYVILEE